MKRVLAMFVVRVSAVPFDMSPSNCSHGILTGGPVFDRLTARRSRKHVGSDRIPTSAYNLRCLSWILVDREFGQQLCTHSCADADSAKWNLACREPTRTTPRAGNARAIGMSASAWRMNPSRGDQDSVRTERGGPSGHLSHPTPPQTAQPMPEYASEARHYAPPTPPPPIAAQSSQSSCCRSAWQ